ncbi:MAG: nuclear transport factor 2 family protein [bacterium]|nr:nuclear transport factor 2 family protein [bacterium]
MTLYRRGSFLAIMITSLTLGLVPMSGCLFEPRDAEPPTGGSITYLDQSSPGNVLANLETAFQNRDAAGYDRQIAAEFSYEPDADTEASYPDVDWEAWNRETEIAFIQSFFNNVDGIAADLNAVEIQEGVEGTTAEFIEIYAVTVTESGGAVPYRARATFNFRLDGTFWVLTRWFDEQGETDPGTQTSLPTLGQRRGAFAASGGGKASG